MTVDCLHYVDISAAVIPRATIRHDDVIINTTDFGVTHGWRYIIQQPTKVAYPPVLYAINLALATCLNIRMTINIIQFGIISNIDFTQGQQLFL